MHDDKSSDPHECEDVVEDLLHMMMNHTRVRGCGGRHAPHDDEPHMSARMSWKTHVAQDEDELSEPHKCEDVVEDIRVCLQQQQLRLLIPHPVHSNLVH